MSILLIANPMCYHEQLGHKTVGHCGKEKRQDGNEGKGGKGGRGERQKMRVYQNHLCKTLKKAKRQTTFANM